MNFELTDAAKALLMGGQADFIKNEKLRFDSFKVSVNKAFDVDVAFMYKGFHVATMRGPYMNFNTGDTLTVTGIKGKMKVQIV